MKQRQEIKVNPLGSLVDIATFLYLNLLGKEEPLEVRVVKVIDGYGIQNKWEVTPQIIESRPTETGMKIIFSLPPGRTSKDFEGCRLAIEEQLDSVVEIQSAGPVVIVVIHQVKFPKIIPYNFNPKDYPDMLAPLPIGVIPTGKVIVSDMADVYHMLIGGATGYGKTSELLGITVALLLAGCQVSAIDKKALDFPLIEDYVEVATNEADALKLLKFHVKEMERRADLLRQAKVQKIQNYKGDDMPYRVLIIDEATDIEDEDSHEAIDTLVRKARAGGIGLIVTTQKPSANTWKGFTDIRSNLSGRICFYVNGDANDSQVVLGKGDSRGSELKAIRGRCVWKWQDEQVLQSMFIDAEGAIKILEANGVPKREVESIEQRQAARIPT